ncbi:erythromycin esterase family protein [Chitinophaga pollutisoli]|uniref:Erythromycin esterase family protein n=1 Tax=Chitinophaga pollutisoli TaxID=3133966 RepID=A0ABZ2YTT9_9BACT
MKRITMPLLALLCLCANVFAQQPFRLQSTEPTGDYTDLLPLKKQFTSAGIIGAGEGTHGTREFFRMKHRLFRFLAAEMGFTIFAMEDNPIGAMRIQHFLETGEGNPIAIIREHFHSVYQVEELSDLVYWMRQYNLRHEKKLRFTGFDCQQMHYFHQELTGLSTRHQLHLFDSLLGYHADTTITFSKAMEPIISICDSILRIMPAASGGVPEKEWRLARFCVENILAGAHQFRLQATDWTRSFNIRDSMMARNVQWIGAQYPGEKMMLWAHNSHLGRLYADSMFTFRPMGAHLHAMYGKNYQNIAMLAGSGTYRAQNDFHAAMDTGHALAAPLPGSVDAQLQAMQVPLFLLPLGNVQLKGRMRTIGTIASEHQFTLWPVELKERYDWVFYAENTTSARGL